VPSGEATNTNFIVFGLTRSGIDPMIYHTRGEHANHYTTGAVDPGLGLAHKYKADFNIISLNDIAEKFLT
jgi:hypothetical protein